MAENDEKQLFDIENLKQKDIIYIFGIDRKTAFNWVKYGCPKNEDESFSLREVAIWWKNRNSKDQDTISLDNKLLIKRIQKLELEIEEKMKKTISRERFGDIQRNQAHGMMEFLTNGFKRNSSTICAKLGLPGEKIVVYNEIMDDFIKQATDAFSEGGEDID